MPTLTRTDFKSYGLKGSAVLTMLAGLTTFTQRDDAAAALISSLFNEPDKFDDLCVLLGIPPDTTP